MEISLFIHCPSLHKTVEVADKRRLGEVEVFIQGTTVYHAHCEE